MKPKIIIINGNSGVGKDKFIELFQSLTQHGVINLTTIKPVEDAMESLKIERSRDDKWRGCAAEMKQLTDKYYDISHRYVMRKIKSVHENSFNQYIFVHCREPFNIERLKTQIKNVIGYKCYTLLIERNLNHIPDNHADMNVQDYSYDYVIQNNSNLKMLERQAEWFLSEIGG